MFVAHVSLQMTLILKHFVPKVHGPCLQSMCLFRLTLILNEELQKLHSVCMFVANVSLQMTFIF